MKEHNCLQQYKDANNEMHIIYPITKLENVDGAEALEMTVTELADDVGRFRTELSALGLSVVNGTLCVVYEEGDTR